MDEADRELGRRGWIGDILTGLRTSQLTWLLLALFLVDFAVVDPLPFVDEAMLGLATLLVARWRGRRAAEEKPPTKDVTPGRR